MFFMGMVAALNPCVGYVYIMEIVEKKRETLITTIAQVAESVPVLIGPLYFMYVGNRWEPLVIMGTFVSFVSAVMVFWVEESPRYLLATKQY